MNLNTLESSAVDAPRHEPVRNGRAATVPAGRGLNPSVRVPGSRRNWAYLRALREAEMAAWNKPMATVEPAPRHGLELVRNVAAVSRPDGKERVLYALVAVVAAAAVSYGIWNSFQLSQHWGNFVQLVRTLVG